MLRLTAHGQRIGATPMRYSDYKCFRFAFDSGVAFVSIDHPPINLLDEVLSKEFDRLGRELEADDSVTGCGLAKRASRFLHSPLWFGPGWSRFQNGVPYAQLSSYTDDRRTVQEYAQGNHRQNRGTGPGRRERNRAGRGHVFCCRWQSDLRPTRGGGWACSGRRLYAKIATAHRAGTRLGGAHRLQRSLGGTGRTLRLYQSSVAGGRVDAFRRETGSPHRLISCACHRSRQGGRGYRSI